MQVTSTIDLAGQVAVVTGGTRGVGRRIVERLLEAGCEVVTCGRHEPATSSTAQGIDGIERTARFVAADVRDADEAATVIAAAVAAHGRLDLLVNNAGGSSMAPAATSSPRYISAVVSLNLLAPFFCAQAANEVMQAQASGGHIINIGSVAALRPSPGTAPYAAAKAGLVNLTETLAVEWAPKVRVNCITAGLLDSGAGPEHYGGEEGMARVAATIPLGRMGTPDDVAGAVLALASPLMPYLAGSNLVLHGGGEWPAFLRAAQGTD
jgi:NAD(P)-dependent dehydrogenase (short-subunit alcohol dehydrogenase family)